METLMLSYITDSIQREYLERAERFRTIRDFGSKRCPTLLNAFLAQIGIALSHAGARLEHRTGCGCPEQGVPAPVPRW
jgi:replicative superfamily II helicase